MSINSRSCRSDAVVRSGIAARLADIKARVEDPYPSSGEESDYMVLTQHAPAMLNALESVLDYVGRCEESGITMQPGDVRRLIAAALGGAS